MPKTFFNKTDGQLPTKLEGIPCFASGSRLKQSGLCRLAACPQCVLYDLFGWTLTSLQIFAKLTSLVGVILIALALLKAGFERSLVWLFVISFIAMEPFFNMANQGRYESVMFLFMGAALLLVSYGRITFAGFISAAAVEIQPIGIVVPLFAAIFLLTTRPGSRWEMVRSCLR